MNITDLVRQRHQVQPIIRRKKAKIGIGCILQGTENKYRAEIEGLGTVVWGGSQRYVIKNADRTVWRAVAISARELAMHARLRLNTK